MRKLGFMAAGAGLMYAVYLAATSQHNHPLLIGLRTTGHHDAVLVCMCFGGIALFLVGCFAKSGPRQRRNEGRGMETPLLDFRERQVDGQGQLRGDAYRGRGRFGENDRQRENDCPGDAPAAGEGTASVQRPCDGGQSRRSGDLDGLRASKWPRGAVVRFGPSHGWTFDVMEHEWSLPGGRMVENAVMLIDHLQGVMERSRNKGGDGEYQFWKSEKKKLSRNTVGLAALAQGTVRMGDMYRIVVSAPQSPEQLNDPAWRASSACWKCLERVRERYEAGELSPEEAKDFEIIEEFWTQAFPFLAEKSRSIIVSDFISTLDPFLRAPMRDLFCSGSNITPDDVLENGLVLLVDMAVKEYHDLGLYANVIWKYEFQRAVERRESKSPCFIWSDEAHNFVVPESDMMFLTTARSQRCATVMLTQNINNLYAALGGEHKAKAEVDSLMGCCQTKIFHANSDPVTNQWAETIIGLSMQYLPQPSMPQYALPYWMDQARRYTGQQGSLSMHAQYLPEVRASDFTKLRKGGPQNEFLVEGIMFQGGRIFESTGATWMPVVFDQREE